MPTFKISQLTTATAVSATNQFEINQNGASRSAAASLLSTYVRQQDTAVPVAVSVSSASAAVNVVQTGSGPGVDLLGSLRFVGAASGAVVLRAAATAGAATFTLPTSAGSSGQALITDGTGNLSFGSSGVSRGQSIAFSIIFGS